jgi:hypothetical protein
MLAFRLLCARPGRELSKTTSLSDLVGREPEP